MHFLFDENMPIRLAKGLEILDADNQYGKSPVHKISHMKEYYKPGATDPDIVRLAKRLNAIVVSEDDDYKNISSLCDLIKRLRVGYVLFKFPRKSGCTYDDIVASFITAWPNLKKALIGETPPFMFIIDRSGRVTKHDKFRK